MSVRVPTRSGGTADTDTGWQRPEPSRYLLNRASLKDTIEGTAGDLLRAALLCKLALDLGDPVLARRAAREAAPAARLLAGLDYPVDAGELPEVGDLLEQLYAVPADTA